MNTINFVQTEPDGLHIVVSDVPCDANGAMTLEVAERVERILDWVKARIQHPFPAPATLTVPFDLHAVD